MKILEVVPYFYPAWAYGGPGKIVYDPARFFAKQGNKVTIYTSDAYDDKSRMPEDKRIKNVANFQVRYFRNFNNLLTYRYNIFMTLGLYIHSLLEFYKFDVVHMHDFYTLQNVWIGFLSRLLHKPYLISVHGCLEEERLKARSIFKNLFLKFFGRSLLNNASFLIATSVNEIPAYQKFGVPKSKIKLIAHGVNKSEFSTQVPKEKCLKHFKLPPKKIVVTYLGRIHQIKGLDMLVEAAVQINNPEIHFVIAGPDDGYLATLKRLIKEKGMEKKITLWHGCFGEERAQLFKASDIFVYPSYSEGFSLGILEAASVGLPMVITTACYFDDIKDYNAGIIVDVDPKSIVRGILSLAGNRSRRIQAGKMAAKLIEDKYSVRAIGRQLLDTYNNAIIKNKR